MSMPRKSARTVGVLVAAVAVTAGLALGGPAYAIGEVEPSPNDSTTVAENNQAAIDATLATIEEPVHQERVRAWMEEATADGSEIISAHTGDYESAAAEGAAQRAYPSGCGLYVLILRYQQTITNDSLTSCLTPYTFLTHQMRITAYHGVFGTPKEVTGVRTYNYAGGTSQSQDLSWTCANHNQTRFDAITKGVMAKNGQEYTTPLVYDTFDQGNIDCGY